MNDTTAWHNSQGLKERTVAAMRADRDADSIIQGVYMQTDPLRAHGYKGCALGCLVRSGLPTALPSSSSFGTGWHQAASAMYGMPVTLAHLIDRLFEIQPESNCAAFAVDVIEAIPVGADLELVVSRFVLDVLADSEQGVWSHCPPLSTQSQAVNRVVELYRRRIGGNEPSDEEWDAAAAAADAADADACAADAAHAACVACTAADAAHAAAADVCAADAEWMAGRLIYHLSTAPQGEKNVSR